MKSIKTIYEGWPVGKRDVLEAIESRGDWPVDQIFVGVDPGATGAIAVLTDGLELAHYQLQKCSPRSLIDLFDGLGKSGRVTMVVEKCWGGPRMKSSAAFNFGQNYGTLLTAIEAAQLPFKSVPAITWQKRLGLISKKGLKFGSDVKKRENQKAAVSVFGKLPRYAADSYLICAYSILTKDEL